MDAMKVILSRRSIRKYTAQPVADEVVTDLLRAGMSAPSSNNGQPWQFVVINDRHMLDYVPRFHPYSQMLTQAPVAILVCGDGQVGSWVQDCSAATENILLAAHAQGLGAVWLGVYPVEERIAGIRKLVGLPEHIMPLALISIGYPAETKPPADRYDTAKVHYNQWS